MSQTVATFHAEKFEPWKLLGDYALIDRLVERYPEGFDVKVTRHGVYHFRPSSLPQDPDIQSFGIYVSGDRVYRVTSSLYGKRSRKQKNESGLGTSEETPKT